MFTTVYYTGYATLLRRSTTPFSFFTTTNASIVLLILSTFLQSANLPTVSTPIYCLCVVILPATLSIPTTKLKRFRWGPIKSLDHLLRRCKSGHKSVLTIYLLITITSLLQHIFLSTAIHRIAFVYVNLLRTFSV